MLVNRRGQDGLEIRPLLVLIALVPLRKNFDKNHKSIKFKIYRRNLNWPSYNLAYSLAIYLTTGKL